MKLVPRNYQLETAKIACEKNSIINIKTGGGKTLIAALVIDNFINLHNDKNILFIVPTRALVHQQAEYFKQQCNFDLKNNVIEVCGAEIDFWDEKIWKNILKENRLIIGTPAIFCKAIIDQGFFSANIFSLVIFDECHNAIGNSPMACLIRDAIHIIPIDQQPRIVGLTASFINGSLTEVIKKRQKLEVLMQSNIISPVVTEDKTISARFHKVNVSNGDLSIYKDLVFSYISAIFDSIPNSLMDYNDKQRWMNRGWLVFVCTGSHGLVFLMKEGIIKQLSDEADDLANRIEQVCLNKAKFMKERLKSIIEIISNINFSNSLPVLTPKLKSLLDLLWKLFIDKNGINGGGDNKFRGIIFVEQVTLTYPLVVVVNNFFLEQFSNMNNNNNNNNHISNYVSGNSHIVLPISGTGSMLDKTRDANLQSFKTGQTPLLVSTSALEEGIDVPECSFIIRYDDVKTAKAHIQGSGRARCIDAEIFYFENDPDEQIAKAKAMDSIAKDISLNLSKQDMKIRLEDENKCLNDTLVDRVVYPFYLNKNSSSGNNDDAFAQVNFFNCIQILFEYVQIVMKQSFDPEDCLLEKKTEVVSFIPFETRTSVLSVSYPSPRGIVSIDLDEIDNFWKGLHVEDVVTPVERLTNMSSWDIEKRRAIYVTVVKMHKEGGLLTESNKPTVDAISKTKIVCPVMKRNSKINVKNKFNTNSLKNNS